MSTFLDIQTPRHHLVEWSAGQTRSRWDYDSPDYTLEDMMAAGEHLFRACTDMLRSGDIIYVTDAVNKRATLIVNWVDQTRRTVAWDIDIAHNEKIIVAAGQTYTIRHRGRGKFAILKADGTPVAKDIQSREEAERRLANLMEKAAA